MSVSRWGLVTVVGWVVALAVAVPAGATPADQVTEFSAGITPGGQPTEIVAGPDGNLWFTEYAGDRIGRITTAGLVTEFSAGITPGSRPADIALGSDGNLWFTEYAGDRIGRITTAGVVTEFSAGITASSRPDGIAAGPDGNLWFTEYAGSRIGRITTAGVVTEFATPSAGSGPYRIAAGPDGNLWFTEYLRNRIGRITTAGVITEFPLTAGGHPEGISAGPDGNVWFTDRLGDQVIARITPSGTVTEFSAGITPGSRPWGIVAGPDGNLWFTEVTGARIGRITTAGVVTELPGVTAGTQPFGIAVGPDGNMWFAELADRIGRITVFETPSFACWTPAVTALAPASGPGGTAVRISGAGFGCATGVLFGDTPALGFSIDGDGQITARAPDHAPGDVDVRVVARLGTSPTLAADRFIFTPDASAAPDPPAGAATVTRRLRCARVPTLTGYTLRQARRVLARDHCGRLAVAGRHPRRRHRHVTSQTPQPGTPLNADGPVPSVRFE